MAIGKVGSFATVEAPKDPLLDTLQNIEQVGFQKRAEDRLIADKKKLEEEKQLAEDVAWDGKFDPTIVGNSKIDDPMLAMSFKAKEEVGQIRRQLKNQSLPYEEKVRLNSRLNKISQSFDVANQTPKIILEKAKEIAKNIDKYDPQSVNIIEGIAKQLETGKYEAYYDENGTARIKIFKTDESGKPIGVLKETTIGDLANEFNPRMKSNYNDLLADAVKTTGVKDITTQKGARILQTKGVDPAVAEAKGDAFAKLIIANPNEVYAAAKKFQVDEKDIDAVYNAVKTDYKNSLDKLVKEDIDSALLGEQRQARKDAQAKKEEEVVIARPSFIKEGGEIIKDVKLQTGTKSFPLGNVIIDSGGGKKQKATNVYVSPGGKMYLRVEETGFEGDSKKTTRYTEKGLKRKAEAEKAKKPFVAEFDDIEDITVSDKKPVVKMLDFGKDANEIGRYAIRMGYNGAEELTDDFIERSGGTDFIKTPSERAKKQEVPTYSKQDLKGAGWTDSQINQAVREGKLKVN